MLTHNILNVLYWICSTLAITYMMYFIFLGMFRFIPLRKKKKLMDKKHRFAAVIAARNESGVIGNLVKTLLAQNYPAELLDVYVIPNNCTDNTRDVADEAGAHIMQIDVPVKSKGEVLQWALDKLMKEEEYDAFLVFDADNLIDPEFTNQMNEALCRGDLITQGFRESKNPHDTGTSGSYSIYYWAINCFFNQARWNIGQSAMINGTGFMLATELLQRLGGFNTYSMTEDIEFSTQCAIAGVKIGWMPTAIVYDEQPLTFTQSWKQRKRWTTGMLQCLGIYSKALAKSFVEKHRFSCVDMLMFYIAPFSQILSMICLALFSTLCVVDMVTGVDSVLTGYAKFFTNMDFTFLATAGFALFTIISAKKDILNLLKGIITFYVFIVSWIPITIVTLFKKTTNWEPIVHSRGISLKDVAAGTAALKK